MTYNHEAFIQKALEGIYNQITDFDFEVVIGDDFSTDRTLDFIKEYPNHPNISRRILPREVGGDYWRNRKRHGRLYNFTDIVSNCKGEYIALLDGDDYWIDTFKLQKQVDFLEENSAVSLVHGPVKIIRDNQLSDEIIGQCKNQRSNIFDLAKGNFIHTPSVMFRNLIDDFPKNFLKSPLGDYFLFMLLARHGELAYSNEVLSGYRIHGDSVWSSKKWKYKKRMSLNAQSLMSKSGAFNYAVVKSLKDSIWKTRKVIWRNNSWMKLCQKCYSFFRN